MNKSEKELAFLYDLYVATDWSERFAGLVDDHVQLPKKGQVLYVAAGTGAHALALAERLGRDTSIIGIDESEARIALAQAKTAAVTGIAETYFRRMQLDALDFEDEAFDAIIADASLVAPERLPEILSEMARVIAPRGKFALVTTTRSSFGEFHSVLWEALAAEGFLPQAAEVENLITAPALVSNLEGLAAQVGFEEVQSWTNKEEFEFASGEEFLSAPLVADFLLSGLFAPLALNHIERERVESSITRIIDEEHLGAKFAFSIKATLISGRKS